MALVKERSVAIHAVLQASQVCQQVFNRLVKGQTITKIADFSAQAVVNSILLEHFPDDRIVGEEDSSDLRGESAKTLRDKVVQLTNTVMSPPLSEDKILASIDRGNYEGGARGRHWALDPIDGTKGFLRGEQFAVCLALIVDGEVQLGVMGCPNLPVKFSEPDGEKGSLFIAVKGQGAFQRAFSAEDETPIHFSKVADVSAATFCESVESGHSSHSEAAQIAERLGITKPPVRMDSQAKYCSISRGDADIYLRLPVSDTYVEKIWDHASGSLLVKEAGGRVSDIHGQPLDFSIGRTLSKNKGVVAANASVYDKAVPTLGNQYEDDIAFKSVLKRLLPADVHAAITPDLHRFGQAVMEEIARLGDQVEAEHPTLVQYDAWCRRVDDLKTSAAWEKLHEIAFKEGLVAIAYEREYGEYSRVYQFAKQYLFSPSSAVVTCPFSMTDGAARVLELMGTPEMKETYYKRLISRDPSVGWTSGQWMTERPGGSDVGQTETEAELIDPMANIWSVRGFKWFSSATTADMAMLLARSKDPTSGLTKPATEMRQPDGSLNGVRVHRLKNKYGTKGLPTAELELQGMKAQLVGELGRGVPNIASILNITRIYCVAGSLTAIRRTLAIAKDYATKRVAFGKTLRDQPLHLTTLMEVELNFRAILQLMFYAISLLGKIECNQADKHTALVLRFLTPMAKSWSCKVAVSCIQECMEALGGQGYMEDVGIARHLRDATVNAIWEGTTNVLALDVLRVLKETKNSVLNIFEQEHVSRITTVPSELRQASDNVQSGFKVVENHLKSIKSADLLEAGARELTFSLARLVSGTLLIEQAAWSLKNMGGVIGGVIGLAALGALGWLFYKRRKASKDPIGSPDYSYSDPVVMEDLQPGSDSGYGHVDKAGLGVSSAVAGGAFAASQGA
ncbi:hypothetical protein BZG36_02288, partial [Bifiguratus adelaidae]